MTNNEFEDGDHSHTTMVESYDPIGATITTVEGNSDSAVRSRRIPLLDPKKVGHIVFLARFGLRNFDKYVEPVTPAAGVAGPVPGAAATASSSSTSVGEKATAATPKIEPQKSASQALIESMQQVIDKLVKLSAEQQWIKDTDPNASVYEWTNGGDAKTTAGDALGTE